MNIRNQARNQATANFMGHFRKLTIAARILALLAIPFATPAAAAGSWVAGGMLAPIAEAWPGEESVLELGAAALARRTLACTACHERW